MSASSVLDTLQQLASKDVDEAATRLATANERLKQARDQLALLQGYRQDYLDKLARQLVARLLEPLVGRSQPGGGFVHILAGDLL